MTIEDLEQLKKILEKQVTINEDNVMEKCLELAQLSPKYLNLYNKELKIKKKLEIEKDQLYGQLYHKYKYENQYALDSNKEIDVYVKADEKYYNKCLELNNQEIVTQYLEESLQIINKSGYFIKSYIELLKIKNGII